MWNHPNCDRVREALDYIAKSEALRAWSTHGACVRIYTKYDGKFVYPRACESSFWTLIRVSSNSSPLKKNTKICWQVKNTNPSRYIYDTRTSLVDTQFGLDACIMYGILLPFWQQALSDFHVILFPLLVRNHSLQAYMSFDTTVSFQLYVWHMLRVTRTFWQMWCPMVEILRYALQWAIGPRFFYTYIHLIHTILGCVTVNYMSDSLRYALFFLIATSKSFCYRYADIRSKRYSIGYVQYNITSKGNSRIREKIIRHWSATSIWPFLIW